MLQSYAVEGETVQPVGSFNDRLLMMQRPNNPCSRAIHWTEAVELRANHGFDVFTIGRAPHNDLVLRGYFPRYCQRGRPGTVSRISCRLLCERSFPHRIYLQTVNADRVESLNDGIRKTKFVKLWHPVSKSWCSITSSGKRQITPISAKPTTNDSLTNGTLIREISIPVIKFL